MITESLENGWKTCSNQAAELQLLRAYHENKKKKGHRFLKMDEASITTVQDELAKDIYELTTHHEDEINKMLKEFDDQQITIALELDAYGKERSRQEGDKEENKDAGSTDEGSDQTVPLSVSHHEEELRLGVGRVDATTRTRTTHRSSTSSRQH